jgi:isopropylmalate/homocitrate/citramalate synthase
MVKGENKWLTDKYWVSEANYLDAVRKQLSLPEKVHIHDVTLREAEQTPHVVIKADEKLRIYEALDDLGVYSIELLPVISDDDRRVAKDLISMRREGRKTKVVFLCRLFEEDIDFAAETGADGVVVECAGSPWYAKLALNLTAEELIQRLTAVSSYAKKCGLHTAAMPWEAARSPIEHLEKMYKALADAGVDEIVYADTMGSNIPVATAYMVKKIREWAPNVSVALHGHNDFGLATALMISGVCAGASTVHTSMNFLGERTGNAGTEEVAVGLELLLGVDTGINLERIYNTAKLISEIAKMPIPPNKPIIGDNVFTFESGMVVDMLLRMAQTDRPFAISAFAPELVGRKGYKTIFGKMSGGSIIRNGLSKLGLTATKEQTRKILDRIKREAIIRKWSVPDDEFESIAREILGGK